MIKQDGNKLIYFYDGEKLVIEPWCRGLRVRAAKTNFMPVEDWALLPAAEAGSEGEIKKNSGFAEITNGKIKAVVANNGKLAFYNQKGELLLEEYIRSRSAFVATGDIKMKGFASALEIKAREFKPHLGGDYALTVRFEANDGEKIFGMGQYQQPHLDLKGCELELAHRNSQSSVPFMLSSKGYGFLWNNPAIGSVTFGKNITSWRAESAKAVDYWITAGDTPPEIYENYSEATGKTPLMPEYAMGFWQCKLRYQTQEELLSVAREYKRRGLPLSVIVIDFFHWTKHGEWKFDKRYWPDVDAMNRELKEMGVELMVSVWPTVERGSENYGEMEEKGYLVRQERGVRAALDTLVFIDPTNPEAREYIWSKVKQNYYDKGIKIFWLDEAEPEYQHYDFDNYRYYLGPNLQIGNIYPLTYAQAFYDGMTRAGQNNVINLIRCAWAGSQRYGALVWSGDIDSSFESMRNQFAAGLNMSMSGIPWWTTDIGGFHGGNPNDENFRELFIRWFEYGTFCPVMRLHGDREPRQKQLGTDGGGLFASGADNEVWSYGEEVYEICVKYLNLRERLKPYINDIMLETHKKGALVMRPLFYEFPNDTKAWEADDAYMFGSELLIAPVMYKGIETRPVYLPQGAAWKNFWTGEVMEGGQTITTAAPKDIIPVMIRLDEESKSSRYGLFSAEA